MIELPESLHFAEVEGALGQYCVWREGDEMVLCGAPLVAVTLDGWGPEDWSEVHRECVSALTRLGRCPVCKRLVEVERGRVGVHGAGCVGVNMRAVR